MYDKLATEWIHYEILNTTTHADHKSEFVIVIRNDKARSYVSINVPRRLLVNE